MKRLLLLTAVLLVSVALICTGCKKKEGEGVKPSDVTDTSTSAQTNTQSRMQIQTGGDDENIEPPPPPPEETTESSNAGGSQSVVKPVIKQPSSSSGIKHPGAVEISKDLKAFETLAGPDEKMEFISEFSDANPDELPGLVKVALDDKDAEVRLAAMEALVEQQVTGPQAIDAVTKAITDESEEVRQSAIEACAYLTEPEAADLLAYALDDPSEDVRTSAITAADEKEPPDRLKVLKAGLYGKYDDVKETVVSSLVDMSTHEAVDVLLPAMKDTNPDFRETVSDALDFLIGQEFKTYDEAVRWWKANRNRFDEELNEIE